MTSTRPLPKAQRIDARCQYDVAFATWRNRPVIADELRGLVAATLANLAERLDATIHARSVTPNSLTLRVTAPPTISPNSIVCRIKLDLCRALTTADPTISARVPAIFTHAAWIRSVGTPISGAADEFIARERGVRA
jgi:REP element-mobilizing transposase RayT